MTGVFVVVRRRAGFDGAVDAAAAAARLAARGRRCLVGPGSGSGAASGGEAFLVPRRAGFAAVVVSVAISA
ncbi:MAG TPA: hypothetical protein VIM39_09825 [Candidatus Limnocylindrales bacterium]